MLFEGLHARRNEAGRVTVTRAYLHCPGPHQRLSSPAMSTTSTLTRSEYVTFFKRFLFEADLTFYAHTCTRHCATHSIDIANRGADAFLRMYYKAYDSPARGTDLPKFYRAASHVVWNGTQLVGADAVAEFLRGLPKTHHDVQSYDCHPIPGKPYYSVSSQSSIHR